MKTIINLFKKMVKNALNSQSMIPTGVIPIGN